MSIYLKAERRPRIMIDGFTITLFMIAIIASIATMTIKIKDLSLFQKMVIIALFNVMGGFAVVTLGFQRTADRRVNAFEIGKMMNAFVIGLIIIMVSTLMMPVLVPYATLEDRFMNILFMIAVATGEEFFFRYWIYNFGVLISGSVYISAFAQAVIFALFHITSYTEMGFSTSAFILAFIAGLVFMWQDLYSGRLSTSMFTHILWNTLPIVMGTLV